MTFTDEGGGGGSANGSPVSIKGGGGGSSSNKGGGGGGSSANNKFISGGSGGGGGGTGRVSSSSSFSFSFSLPVVAGGDFGAAETIFIESDTGFCITVGAAPEAGETRSPEVREVTELGKGGGGGSANESPVFIKGGGGGSRSNKGGGGGGGSADEYILAVESINNPSLRGPAGAAAIQPGLVVVERKLDCFPLASFGVAMTLVLGFVPLDVIIGGGAGGTPISSSGCSRAGSIKITLPSPLLTGTFFTTFSTIVDSIAGFSIIWPTLASLII